MAVLLHVFFDAREASVVANIKIAGIMTVPVRLSATEDGIIITSPRGAKLLSPDRSGHTESIKKALRKNVSVVYTKLIVSVLRNSGDGVEKLLNFFASIINFALIYNTRFDFLGKKEFNLQFFEGPPNLWIEGRMLIKYNLAGIIFSLLKILFAR